MLRCVLVCLLYMSPWFTCLCHLHVIEDRVLLSVIGSAAHDLSRKRKGRTPGALWSRPGGDNTFDSTSLISSCCSIRVTGFYSLDLLAHRNLMKKCEDGRQKTVRHG
jgi:hypothetical protein